VWLQESSSYESRVQSIKEFNAANRFIKRGISIVPVKFNASWEAQNHMALVNVYPDGSVGIHNSGCEMGQGLDVKVAQVDTPFSITFVMLIYTTMRRFFLII
jgi:xanthine dehydrogenase molybdopterin-binding subunit B